MVPPVAVTQKSAPTSPFNTVSPAGCVTFAVEVVRSVCVPVPHAEPVPVVNDMLDPPLLNRYPQM